MYTNPDSTMENNQKFCIKCKYCSQEGDWRSIPAYCCTHEEAVTVDYTTESGMLIGRPMSYYDSCKHMRETKCGHNANYFEKIETTLWGDLKKWILSKLKKCFT